MDGQEKEDARRRLAGEGVTERDDGTWADATCPGRRLTAAEVAVARAEDVFGEESEPPEALRLAFGLVDLLDAYRVTGEIRFALADPDDGLPAEAVWDGYRGRPEAPTAGETGPCSLRVDGFEDRGTSAAAFEEVLGRDATRLREDAPAPLPRRARRVPEVSGPVPWPVQLPAYRAAAAVAALRPAVFRGLPDGCHAVYGGLDPAAALDLLTALGLPPDTEHPPAPRRSWRPGTRTTTAPRTPGRTNRPRPGRTPGRGRRDAQASLAQITLTNPASRSVCAGPDCPTVRTARQPRTSPSVKAGPERTGLTCR
ncbi:hypothetical protein [Streptomyces sp. NPDC047999]|uniref:hypothetical protein n=1 Tax=Streptomyces sp. NPDC047999 TaxID=3365497 RepID=UPI0037122F68